MQHQYPQIDEGQSILDRECGGQEQPKESIRGTWHRWLALAFSCLIMLAFICALISLRILMHKFNRKKEDLKYLRVIIYSLPNTLLPLVSGYLVDIIGVRKCIFLFSLILIIGQGICTIGVEESIKLYSIVVAGRAVFGLGGESLTVCQNTIVSKWFCGKDLSFALGMTITVASLGSIMSSFIFPAIYDISNQVFFPLLVGTVTCFFSWCCGIFLILMDEYADQQEGNKKKVKLNDEDQITIKDINKLKGNYWWLCCSCALAYVCFLQFMQTFQDYLIKQFGLPESTAANFLSIPYFIQGVLTPLVGIFIDKFGKRGKILLGSSALLFIAHTLMIIIPQCGNESDTECISYWFIIPLVILGAFISIFGAAIWPCIPVVCDPRLIGTAFGIVTCIQNLGLTLGPIVTGVIIKNTSKDNGFFWDQIFFILMSLLLIGINLNIYLYDIRTDGGQLDKPNHNQNKEQNEDQQYVDDHHNSQQLIPLVNLN